MTDEPEDAVDRAFEALEQSPPSSSWRDVRTVLRRRRQVRAGIATSAIVVAVAAFVIVARLGDSGSGRSQPPVALGAGIEQAAHLGSAVQLVSKSAPLGAADASAVSATATSEQDFTTALLQNVTAGPADNISVSPASLAIALAMLQNGAKGDTHREIAAALHASSMTQAAVNAGWAGLTSQWQSAAKAAGIEFSSANSLWQQKGLPLRKEFMAALARYFASGVWQVNFAKDMPGALSALNTWTAQHTHGKIPKLFDSLDPTTMLVLANAVYFHASWQTPFTPSDSEPGEFSTLRGVTSTATYMSSPDLVDVATTGDYQAAQLPYHGGRFAALAIMPTHGSLAQFSLALDGTKLTDIASSLTDRALIKLPRFTTTSQTNLAPVLQAMGMSTAFTDQADFSAMSSAGMKVGQAIQRVYLKVGEKGTEAAAATGITMVPLSGGAGFNGIVFDHPFLFLIRDTQTGAVLFASQINHPDPS